MGFAVGYGSQGIIWGVGGWGRGPANAMADKRAAKVAAAKAAAPAQNATANATFVTDGDPKAKAYVQSMAGRDQSDIVRGLEALGYTVYEGLDATGKVRYIGITKRDPAVRFSEHINSGTERSSLDYNIIPGAEGLSRNRARIIEQTLINRYGMQKNGGDLLNRVNSIAPKYWPMYNIKK